MIKTHKVKLRPNKTMIKQLDKLFGYRNFVWNKALETWNDIYDSSVIMNDKKCRPNERKVRDELVLNKEDWQYSMSARVLQLTVTDLAKAWKNYFNPAMPNHDRPKFKSKKHSKKSFTTDRAKIINGKLRLDKPKEADSIWYDIKMVESVRFEGELKLTTIKLEADGYYASLTINVDETPVKRKPKVITGVDVNVGKFDYKAKNGYANQKTLPSGLLKLYEKVTHYQRLLARKRVANPNRFNSNNYRATRTKLQRAYQDINRIQEDLLHKFTAQLVKENDVIVIEDLDNNHMKMNKRLAKNLHRALFGRFKTMLPYKAEWNGATVILADRFFPSTQRCSKCGNIKIGDDKITLSGNKKHKTKHEEYHCYSCGAMLERDENAVENLIWYGKQVLKLN